MTALAWEIDTKPMFLGPKTLAVSFLAVADSSGQAWNMEVTEDVSAPRIAIVQDLQNVEEDANGVSAAQPLSLASRDGRQITQFCWILQNGVVSTCAVQDSSLIFVDFVCSSSIDSRIRNSAL